MKNFKSTKSDIVVRDGTVHIPSIFMFKGGPEDLFPFLYECQIESCTVVFDNENITVYPKSDSYQNVTLSLYSWLGSNPKIFNEYSRYMLNIDKMKWPEPVSKED